MIEQKEKAEGRPNSEVIQTTCDPNNISISSTTTNLSHSSIICDNITMDTEFLVQIRQCNKWGHVRNDDM